MASLVPLATRGAQFSMAGSNGSFQHNEKPPPDQPTNVFVLITAGRLEDSRQKEIDRGPWQSTTHAQPGNPMPIAAATQD
ncbi:hypothetical protein E2562_037029 [Oryza meyeriana var. granulata]|uniref:Uncharacterized protein n=1 Tax=Oryza meyeriana var. granulata TaxID=110450 RepID=A0A6G1DAR7_9ORYZ|nr:hypothetical protein E2562_037029 [Oryza meyeriana var. granulata]